MTNETNDYRVRIISGRIKEFEKLLNELGAEFIRIKEGEYCLRLTDVQMFSVIGFITISGEKGTMKDILNGIASKYSQTELKQVRNEFTRIQLNK